MDETLTDESEWESYEFEVSAAERENFILDTLRPIVRELQDSTSGESNNCDNSNNNQGENDTFGFHIVRGNRNGSPTVKLRINAGEGVEDVIDKHSDVEPQPEDDSSKWIRRDKKQAGEHGARLMATEREKSSEMMFEALEDTREGRDINLDGLFRRRAHIAANQLGYKFPAAVSVDTGPSTTLVDGLLAINPEPSSTLIMKPLPERKSSHKLW